MNEHPSLLYLGCALCLASAAIMVAFVAVAFVAYLRVAG